MTSKANLELTQSLVQLSGSLCLTPLRVSKLRYTDVISDSQVNEKIMKCWRWIAYFSLTVTIAELYFNVRSTKLNILAILYHYDLLMAKVGTIGFLYAFQREVNEIKVALDFILNTSRTQSGKLPGSKRNDTGGLLLPTLLLISTVFPAFFILGIPITSLIFYQQLHLFYVEGLGNICQNCIWKITVFLLEIIFMVPAGCMSSLAACVALVILDFTLVRIQCLIDRCADHTCKIGPQYRQLQVFTLICNVAFKNYIWGTTQFLGGAALIPFLYGLITLHGKLGAWVMSEMLVLVVTTIIYFGLVFHVGGTPMILSEKFLHLTESSSRKCQSCNRYFRSCTVIAMRIGEFHKLDRKRGPDFFRFVLQRTAYFVANTGRHSQLDQDDFG